MEFRVPVLMLFSEKQDLTVAVSEIWDILEMGKKNARTFLKF